MPGLCGAVWHDTALGINTLGIVVLDALGAGSLCIPIPQTTDLLDGVAFAVQALTADPTGTAALTNPVDAVLRR